MDYLLPEIFGSGLFDTSERLKYKNLDISVPTPLRKVQEYELELFLEDGGISVINGRSYDIKQGCILLASPGDRRQSFLHFKALFVHFGTSDPAVRDMLSGIARFNRKCDFLKYFPLFSEICSTRSPPDIPGDIEIRSALLNLLCKLKRDSDTESRQSDPGITRPDIRSAVDYINNHFAEPLSIDELAKNCSLSISYFYKIFTQITDLTPNEFIVNTRISAAENLLGETDLPIVEIASRCGFNSQSYFSFSFKSKLGVTPKEYRRRHLYRI